MGVARGILKIRNFGKKAPLQNPAMATPLVVGSNPGVVSVSMIP
jgi:hypothetical protein